MKKKDLERFSVRLMEEKAKLLNHSNQNKTEDLTLSTDDLADEVDLASSELNQTVALRLRDRERLLLQKIEEALAKIADGSFGTCELCEDPIEVKRLEARPVANLCIRCKEAQEKAEKVFA
ncbi:MAG: TraR/DksA C4-type zinc finger protein [Deltaproteobacteria bacterium]|nr:TraR/DksA C4-type zinc finger protein [Deltaproteobacteria bacterium]MBI3293895.1 TraR/DksA C4-type zinc finger protein [Deltaproteobacteria bacterium]